MEVAYIGITRPSFPRLIFNPHAGFMAMQLNMKAITALLRLSRGIVSKNVTRHTTEEILDTHRELGIRTGIIRMTREIVPTLLEGLNHKLVWKVVMCIYDALTLLHRLLGTLFSPKFAP